MSVAVTIEYGVTTFPLVKRLTNVVRAGSAPRTDRPASATCGSRKTRPVRSSKWRLPLIVIGRTSRSASSISQPRKSAFERSAVLTSPLAGFPKSSILMRPTRPTCFCNILRSTKMLRGASWFAARPKRPSSLSFRIRPTFTRNVTTASSMVARGASRDRSVGFSTDRITSSPTLSPAARARPMLIMTASSVGTGIGPELIVRFANAPLASKNRVSTPYTLVSPARRRVAPAASCVTAPLRARTGAVGIPPSNATEPARLSRK